MDWLNNNIHELQKIVIHIKYYRQIFNEDKVNKNRNNINNLKDDLVNLNNRYNNKNIKPFMFDDNNKFEIAFLNKVLLIKIKDLLLKNQFKINKKN